MFLRLFALLALCVSASGYSNAASVNEASSGPEDVISEFYRLMSFEAGSRPDYASVRQMLSDDAVILLSAQPEDAELVGADESIQRIRQQIDEIGFEEFGLKFTPRDINCRINVTTAYCVTVVEVEYPGLDAKPITSTDLTTLELRQGRWLATSSALFVTVPDVTPPSILPYPVVRKDAVRVEGRKWERPLPFLAQKVIDLGYDLPKPFGISIIPVVMRQDMTLTNLAFSLTGGPLQGIDIVNFATPSVESNTLQFKLDAWLFPFMNVFASFGLLDGSANVPVIIQGVDLMNYVGLGARCDGGLLEPNICQRTLAAEVKPVYEGETYTAGFTVATGWKQMFVAIPASYSWTNLNDGKEAEAFNISPRIGVNSDIGSWGIMSTYIGATYLDSTNKVSGVFTFDTSDSGVPELGDTVTVDYEIDQSNKDKWNYLIGFNWNISRRWSAQAEAGFGGSRSNFISSFTYRY
jgi:hypothetical protein